MTVQTLIGTRPADGRADEFIAVLREDKAWAEQHEGITVGAARLLHAGPNSFNVVYALEAANYETLAKLTEARVQATAAGSPPPVNRAMSGASPPAALLQILQRREITPRESSVAMPGSPWASLNTQVQVVPGRREEFMGVVRETQGFMEGLGARFDVWTTTTAGPNTGRIAVRGIVAGQVALGQLLDRLAEGGSGPWGEAMGSANPPATTVALQTVVEIPLG